MARRATQKSEIVIAKFYSNENFPVPVVQALRDRGHDVATIQERGRANESTPDSEVLTMAASEGRVLLTLNRKDFYREHNKNPNHAGIIVCVVDPDFQQQAQAIHDRLQAEGDLQGRIIRVPPRT